MVLEKASINKKNRQKLKKIVLKLVFLNKRQRFLKNRSSFYLKLYKKMSINKKIVFM